MIKVTYHEYRWTAKAEGKQACGTWKPDGTVENFTRLMDEVGRKLCGRAASFDREKIYDWGHTIWAHCGEKKIIVFVR